MVKNEKVLTVNGTNDRVPLSEGAESLTHHFVSFEFQDSSGDPATPGAGTISIKGVTVNNPNNPESLLNGDAIDATATEVTLSAAGNIKEWDVTSDSITTATHVKITTTSNEF